MADLAFFINNLPAPPPDNWQNLDIELSFENNSPDASIKTTNFEWLGENAHILYKWYKNGLTGGNGIYEGIPFRIESCTPGVIVFDGCIDLSSAETTFQCDKIVASCIETNRVQVLEDRIDGFSFAYLKSIGSITNADYIKVPYVISTIPDWMEVAILVTTFIGMIKVIRDSILATNGYIVSAAASLATPWLAAVFSALALASILYSVFLLVIAMNVLLLIIHEIIQLIKFKYAMKVLTLMQKGASHLGLSFSSTILQGIYKDAVIMPRKSAYYTDTSAPDFYLNAIFAGSGSTQRKVYNDVMNPNAYGYYDGTFGQLIRDLEDIFNAKVVVRNNILYFERWDYWNNNATFTMPNQSSEAPFEDPYGTNASELSSNNYVVWMQDNQDENTMDQYEGMSCQMTLKPNVIGVQKNVLLKRLTEKRLNFALAKRKLNLTVPEQIVNKIIGGIGGFYSVLSTLNNTFSSNPSPPLPAISTNNRVGALLLSSDFTSVAKFFIVESAPRNWSGVSAYNISATNTQSNHLGLTDAYYLAKNYHSASWAVDTINGTTKYPNQYLTYRDKEIPLCCCDFKTLRDNNIINSWDGKKGRVESIRWNPHTETARIDFRIKEVFTKNLSQNIVIDGQ